MANANVVEFQIGNDKWMAIFGRGCCDAAVTIHRIPNKNLLLSKIGGKDGVFVGPSERVFRHCQRSEEWSVDKVVGKRSAAALGKILKRAYRELDKAERKTKK
jgi:uncharacterized membrane protein YsdA (DUF1294 family)